MWKQKFEKSEKDLKSLKEEYERNVLILARLKVRTRCAESGPNIANALTVVLCEQRNILITEFKTENTRLKEEADSIKNNFADENMKPYGEGKDTVGEKVVFNVVDMQGRKEFASMVDEHLPIHKPTKSQLHTPVDDIYDTYKALEEAIGEKSNALIENLKKENILIKRVYICTKIILDVLWGRWEQLYNYMDNHPRYIDWEDNCKGREWAAEYANEIYWHMDEQDYLHEDHEAFEERAPNCDGGFCTEYGEFYNWQSTAFDGAFVAQAVMNGDIHDDY